MANDPNIASGLQPINRFGSSSYRGNLAVFAAPTTNALFLGDPVIRIAASAVTSGTDGVYQKVDLITAGSGNKITGVVVGFLGTSPNGAFFGGSGTPGPKYKATNAATQEYVLVDTDPNSEFVVQCTGTPAGTVVGKTANLISGTGSKYTGWSGWQISATTATGGSGSQAIIMGFLQDPTNTVGNKFPKLIVRINNSTEAVGVAGI